MKVLSIVNQKGGVGKTTSTYNIAAALAENNKVLILDSDSQCSLTLMTGNNPLSYETNLCDVYEDSNNIKNCIYQTSIDNLDIIPASLKLAKIETKLFAEGLGRETKIKKALSNLNDAYDYVIIDCPPSLSMITLNNLVASDGVVVPCETSPLAIYALDDLIETVESVKEVNSKIKIVGIIATRYDKRTTLDKKALSELENNYHLLGVIKNTTDARKGIEEGLPTVVCAKNSDIAKAYIEIANKIEEEL